MNITLVAATLLALASPSCAQHAIYANPYRDDKLLTDTQSSESEDACDQQNLRIVKMLPPARQTPRSNDPAKGFCSLDHLFSFCSFRQKETRKLSIKVKPSPAANIRRLAETGLSGDDIRQVTGYGAAEIKRALGARRPLKK